MTKKRLLYIVSDIDKALAFEWTAAHFKTSYDLQFILIGKSNTALEQYLKTLYVPVHVITDEDYAGHVRKWLRLTRLLFRLKPDIVHTHLWRATLLGISSAWVLRIKKRIFTRHHAMIHYTQYPSGRKWDRLCNRLATHIVAISKNIKTILVEWDHADARKVVVIHHGFKLTEFEEVDRNRIDRLREKYSVDRHFPVVGVIARYTSWKGIQYVIPAFVKIQNEYPDALLVLANARGDYKNEISRMLKEVSEHAVRQIEFENDLGALYKLFDVYVHIPIDEKVEAFGQTYVEALASGVPSVVTLSGVAPEFIRHEYNALVVDYKDAEKTAQAILSILRDKNLSQSLVNAGSTSVQEFSLPNMLTKLEALYEGS